MATLLDEKSGQATAGKLPTSLDDMVSDQAHEALAVLPSLSEARRVPAEENAGGPGTEPPSNLKADVRRLVRLHPPHSAPRRFEVLQQWEGTIVQLTNDSFWAELSDLTTRCEPVETVEIPFAEVSPGDKPLLAEGNVFYWSIGYEKSAAGQISRVSEIRMRRTPTWSQHGLDTIRADARRWMSRLTSNGYDDTSGR